MLALSRRFGWGMLCSALLSVGPVSAAKPVGQVWTEMKGFRLLVVSPDSPAATAWVQNALNNLPVRVLHPRDYDPRRSLQAGEQVCLLYSGEQQAEWPAALLGSLPRNPSSVPADEVLVSCRVVAKAVWETTLAAPDRDQVQAAFGELLRMDSVQFDKSPSAMLSWKLVEALGIGTNGPLLSGWLSYQGSQFQRLRALLNSPVNINPEKLRSVGLTAVALTYAEWRDLGGPTQDILKGLLPGAVAEALERGDEKMVVSGIQTVGGKLRVGACAPNERFLRAVLPSAGEASAPASTPEAAAMRLTNLKSPGGVWELKDLRPFPKVVLVAAQLGNQRQEIALDLAYKLRRSLAETGRWQFIDDQALEASIRRQLQEGAFGQGTQINAAGADAIVVARLHHVERRTEFAEAPARRLTNPPAEFTEGEPSKPDPDARLYVLAGPKVYPQGVNDPKYQQDLQTYNTKFNEWRQRRDQYVANFNAAEVVWEQTLLTRQAVRLDGILEVFSRDGLLVCSTPINSGLRTEARQPRQVTVRGFGTAPAALPLPAAQETVPDTMLNEATAQAAKETAAGLVLMALTPRDGGRPAVVVTGPGPGPATPVGGTTRQGGGQPSTPSTPGGPQLVEVDGVGKLADGDDAARRQALNDALRNAVEKVIGTYVES
ncbi:MAG: hypothetical protein IT204_08490, partial [Fimbriimonadaceae bacterium]|nr:hypothetical protein [Fimbriimonadaceae bacterium]